MTFERSHNSFREALQHPRASPVVRSKKPRGGDEANLTGKLVLREESRRSDSRGGDRHRLCDAEARLRVGRRTYQVDLINFSGGGAMIEGSFPAKLWQSVTLMLGEAGETECVVRWIRDKRYGLEFAHETRIDCDPALLNELLRKVLTDQAPVEAPSELREPDQPVERPDARRSAKRHPLIWSGIIQHNDESMIARLRNISADGAQIQSSISCATGSLVVLDLGNAGAIPATVQWSHGDQAGLAFHEPFDIRRLAEVRPQVAGRPLSEPDSASDQTATSAWASHWGRLSVQELKRAVFR